MLARLTQVYLLAATAHVRPPPRRSGQNDPDNFPNFLKDVEGGNKGKGKQPKEVLITLVYIFSLDRASNFAGGALGQSSARGVGAMIADVAGGPCQATALSSLGKRPYVKQNAVQDDSTVKVDIAAADYLLAKKQHLEKGVRLREVEAECSRLLAAEKAALESMNMMASLCEKESTSVFAQAQLPGLQNEWLKARSARLAFEVELAARAPAQPPAGSGAAAAAPAGTSPPAAAAAGASPSGSSDAD